VSRISAIESNRQRFRPNDRKIGKILAHDLVLPLGWHGVDAQLTVLGLRLVYLRECGLRVASAAERLPRHRSGTSQSFCRSHQQQERSGHRTAAAHGFDTLLPVDP
jgi:hypothetical protein